MQDSTSNWVTYLKQPTPHRRKSNGKLRPLKFNPSKQVQVDISRDAAVLSLAGTSDELQKLQERAEGLPSISNFSEFQTEVFVRQKSSPTEETQTIREHSCIEHSPQANPPPYITSTPIIRSQKIDRPKTRSFKVARRGPHRPSNLHFKETVSSRLRKELRFPSSTLSNHIRKSRSSLSAGERSSLLPSTIKEKPQSQITSENLYKDALNRMEKMKQRERQTEAKIKQAAEAQKSGWKSLLLSQLRFRQCLRIIVNRALKSRSAVNKDLPGEGEEEDEQAGPQEPKVDYFGFLRIMRDTGVIDSDASKTSGSRRASEQKWLKLVWQVFFAFVITRTFTEEQLRQKEKSKGKINLKNLTFKRACDPIPEEIPVPILVSILEILFNSNPQMTTKNISELLLAQHQMQCQTLYQIINARQKAWKGVREKQGLLLDAKAIKEDIVDKFRYFYSVKLYDRDHLTRVAAQHFGGKLEPSNYLKKCNVRSLTPVEVLRKVHSNPKKPTEFVTAARGDHSRRTRDFDKKFQERIKAQARELGFTLDPKTKDQAKADLGEFLKEKVAEQAEEQALLQQQQEQAASTNAQCNKSSQQTETFRFSFNKKDRDSSPNRNESQLDAWDHHFFSVLARRVQQARSRSEKGFSSQDGDPLIPSKDSVSRMTDQEELRLIRKHDPNHPLLSALKKKLKKKLEEGKQEESPPNQPRLESPRLSGGVQSSELDKALHPDDLRLGQYLESPSDQSFDEEELAQHLEFKMQPKIAEVPKTTSLRGSQVMDSLVNIEINDRGSIICQADTKPRDVNKTYNSVARNQDLTSSPLINQPSEGPIGNMEWQKQIFSPLKGGAAYGEEEGTERAKRDEHLRQTANFKDSIIKDIGKQMKQKFKSSSKFTYPAKLPVRKPKTPSPRPSPSGQRSGMKTPRTRQDFMALVSSVRAKQFSNLQQVRKKELEKECTFKPNIIRDTSVPSSCNIRPVTPKRTKLDPAIFMVSKGKSPAAIAKKAAQKNLKPKRVKKKQPQTQPNQGKNLAASRPAPDEPEIIAQNQAAVFSFDENVNILSVGKDSGTDSEGEAIHVQLRAAADSDDDMNILDESEGHKDIADTLRTNRDHYAGDPRSRDDFSNSDDTDLNRDRLDPMDFRSENSSEMINPYPLAALKNQRLPEVRYEGKQRQQWASPQPNQGSMEQIRNPDGKAKKGLKKKQKAGALVVVAAVGGASKVNVDLRVGSPASQQMKQLYKQQEKVDEKYNKFYQSSRLNRSPVPPLPLHKLQAFQSIAPIRLPRTPKGKSPAPLRSPSKPTQSPRPSQPQKASAPPKTPPRRPPIRKGSSSISYQDESLSSGHVAQRTPLHKSRWPQTSVKKDTKTGLFSREAATFRKATGDLSSDDEGAVGEIQRNSPVSRKSGVSPHRRTLGRASLLQKK